LLFFDSSFHPFLSALLSFLPFLALFPILLGKKEKKKKAIKEGFKWKTFSTKNSIIYFKFISLMISLFLNFVLP